MKRATIELKDGTTVNLDFKDDTEFPRQAIDGCWTVQLTDGTIYIINWDIVKYVRIKQL